MSAKFVLEGTWRGYSSTMDRVIHREICGERKAEWANQTFSILFTDGTTLELHARPKKPREKVQELPSYDALIHKCYMRGVSSVAALHAPKHPHCYCGDGGVKLCDFCSGIRTACGDPVCEHCAVKVGGAA